MNKMTFLLVLQLVLLLSVKTAKAEENSDSANDINSGLDRFKRGWFDGFGGDDADATEAPVGITDDETEVSEEDDEESMEAEGDVVEEDEEWAVRIQGRGETGAKLYVDDISISPGPCPPPGNCDFEDDFCSWELDSELNRWKIVVLHCFIVEVITTIKIT